MTDKNGNSADMEGKRTKALGTYRSFVSAASNPTQMVYDGVAAEIMRLAGGDQEQIRYLSRAVAYAAKERGDDGGFEYFMAAIRENEEE